MPDKKHTFGIPFTTVITGTVYISGTREEAEREAKRLAEQGFDHTEYWSDSKESTDVHFNQIEDLGEEEGEDDE